MKKPFLTLIVGLVVGVAIGAWAVTFKSDGNRPQSTPAEFPRESVENEYSGLSRVLFMPYYGKFADAIELKFEKQIIFIDGEVFTGNDLPVALRKKKEQKNPRYLVLVSEDSERLGSIVERLPALRRLEFEFVVVTCAPR